MNKFILGFIFASSLFSVASAHAQQNSFECRVLGNFRSPETNSIYVFSGKQQILVDLILNDPPVSIGKKGSRNGAKLKLNIAENGPSQLKLTLHDADSTYSKEVPNTSRLITLHIETPTTNFMVECVNPVSARDYIVER